MFHWICPECGQEIAPGVKECPVCEPQAGPSPVPFSGLSAAVTPALEVAPATLPIELPPVVASEPEVVSEPEIVLEPEVVLQPEVVLVPEVVLQPEVVNNAAPKTIPETPDVRPVAPWESPTFADRLASLAERLHGEHIPYSSHQMIPSESAERNEAERSAERVPVIIDVTPSRPMLASPPSMLLLAEPQPPGVAAELPTEEVFHPRPAAHSARSQAWLGEGASALAAALGQVQIPDRPDRVAAPALAALQDYYQAADRQMRPAEYSSKAVASATEPKITLPGPALPRELMSLQAAGLVPIGRIRRDSATSALYGWKTRMAVLAILLTAGVGYWVMPGTSASAPVKQAVEPVQERPVAARPANSLARFVEVTGIRFMEVNRKPQIHYLVVNHSSAPLGSVMVYVTLRASGAKPGQPPLARLTFRSPDLAAFEAKEMFSSIERASGPLDLPDWQDLHADVEVQ